MNKDTEGKATGTGRTIMAFHELYTHWTLLQSQQLEGQYEGKLLIACLCII